MARGAARARRQRSGGRDVVLDPSRVDRLLARPPQAAPDRDARARGPIRRPGDLILRSRRTPARAGGVGGIRPAGAVAGGPCPGGARDSRVPRRDPPRREARGDGGVPDRDAGLPRREGGRRRGRRDRREAPVFRGARRSRCDRRRGRGSRLAAGNRGGGDGAPCRVARPERRGPGGVAEEDRGARHQRDADHRSEVFPVDLLSGTGGRPLRDRDRRARLRHR